MGEDPLDDDGVVDRGEQLHPPGGPRQVRRGRRALDGGGVDARRIDSVPRFSPFLTWAA
jgi:hypothetical protein